MKLSYCTTLMTLVTIHVEYLSHYGTFQNTALYDHLVSSGFSDFESASCLQPAVSQAAELTDQPQHQVRPQTEPVADPQTESDRY